VYQNAAVCSPDVCACPSLGLDGADCGAGATCTDIAAPNTGYTCACGAGFTGEGTTNETAICGDPDGCDGTDCGAGAMCTDIAAPNTNQNDGKLTHTLGHLS
jgi:hypothetical protein